VATSTLLHFPAKRLPLRVLIADDNRSMRTAIHRVLDDLPNVKVCAVATDGPEAVEMALTFKPDLLIVDLVMPGLSGVEVIGVLKRKLPKAKFILFTMYEDKVGKFLTLSAGADVVIEKSKGLSGLTKKIEAVIAEIPSA
jgi:two-component system, NarL family, response regulator LiaR